ncbi:hypothetical protein [Tardiphaga robiniae]|uniref:Uncharacterized protein n=1 Tax=Tardiphaga robiniae TaxID=943830 RepID=A0A7G6TYZ4_9BRAD|nr:hypothetical protein [Tardiphaga robiniae]QND71976.1 hypothetical protein HB776_12615 [Tardiphaga robiniae]
MTKEEYASLDKKRREALEAEYGYLRKEQGWGDQELLTFLALLLSYRELRRKGPSEYITREDLASAYGSNSTGTASKFMGVIEKIEADQPAPRKRAPNTSQANVSSPHPAILQSAFDGVRKALDTLSVAVSEGRTKESLELAERYQGLLREQQATSDADLAAYQKRVADLEKSSSGSGAEAWKNNEAAESLRTRLVGVEAERDAAVARAEQADHDRELDRVRLAAAEALVQAMQAGAINHAAEVKRLQQELKANEEAARRTETELRGDHASTRLELSAERQRSAEAAAARDDALRARENGATLAHAELDEVRRLHLTELAEMRAAHALEIAAERRRNDELTVAVVRVAGKQSFEGGLQ